MGDTLSQKDIDLLLQGTVPETAAVPLEVVPYNFVRPPRLSKDRRATLDAMFSRFALALQSLLSSRLRTPTDVVVRSLEQAMFSEFVLSLATPSSAFVFSLGDRTSRHGVLDIDTGLAFQLLDRLFGGPGERFALRRPLSALEQTVVRGIVERSLGLLRDACQDHLALAPEITGFESNPEMLQVTSREDNVLVVNLEFKWVNASGFVTLCLPMATLEPILQDRAPQRPATGRPAVPPSARGIADSGLGHARVAVQVRLPLVHLSTRAVAALAPGQVLDTGQPTDGPVEVHVNHRVCFHGTLGQVERRVGVRIVQPVAQADAGRASCINEGRML